MTEHLTNELIEVSLSMFRKNFLGIFHGSVSAKLEGKRFLINNKHAIFDELKDTDFLELDFTEDYRYKDASIDSWIHKSIYQNISEAKYVCYTMPPSIIAYSLKHDIFAAEDYFGSQLNKSIAIYNPKDFATWYERAPHEISKYLEEHAGIMIIKGYGVYAYSRDLNMLVKKIAILENSAKMLLLSQSIK